MAKRILALALACMMVFAIIPGASAADGHYVGEVTINNPGHNPGDSSGTSSYTSTDGVVLIPSYQFPPQGEGTSSVGRLCCADCFTDVFDILAPDVVTTDIGCLPDYCCTVDITYPVFCVNGHNRFNDSYVIRYTGHTYGELNADEYTRTCIDCGYTGRN